MFDKQFTYLRRFLARLRKQEKVGYLLGFVFLGQLPSGCGPKTFDEKMESLYLHTVPLVTASELEEKKRTNSQLALLDIRSEKEYETSHIAGAELLDYETFGRESVAHLAKDAELVVYCSVGYRSERIGEKLIDWGYTNVTNLYGGIFDWKNNGFAVVDEHGAPTDSVHTYNKKWSKWLYKGIKVYE
ncbi:MAG: rhodanese-like domain-containing protein [Cyclobacteriaceae bacterium]|nr:rhodanese-like domain-containing protein [Cyclobacteriaceae bacterium]